MAVIREASIRARMQTGHKEGAAEVPNRRGLRVRATLHGQALDTAIMTRSKRYSLLLPAAVEEAAGITAGEAAVVHRTT